MLGPFSPPLAGGPLHYPEDLADRGLQSAEPPPAEPRRKGVNSPLVSGLRGGCQEFSGAQVLRGAAAGLESRNKAPFEDQSELRTWSLLQHGLNGLAQRTFLGAWKAGRVTKARLGVVNFGPEGWLRPDKLNLIKNVLAERNQAIAFDESERGLLKELYGLSYIIPVVEHKPWQKKKIPILAAKMDEYIRILRERVRNGLYEQSTSSYTSPVFCVLKSNGKLRVVHNLQPLNKVTVKDAGVVFQI
ncbi:hypothetical protein PCANC_25830 [Puccinia coronata f. sp. avenae]|uniref:Uncharacterized protein n=1 Tax=Puccinia coronata f. sp. avenae TaxID=200324 RepID=A0A2N5TUM7_9BASI|nr:hypothetical protein PCANC_25830 [Puccinia coronata f. sp. avenae]